MIVKHRQRRRGRAAAEVHPCSGHAGAKRAAVVTAMVMSAVAGSVATAQSLLTVGADALAGIDSVFAPWSSDSTPGCVVGATQHGRQLFIRAYGMANLEHHAPNTDSTIFEAGSASKQFTAAAILMLAEEGRLSLQDDVRKFITELPDYGETITIDHLLTHTSGLRDWGMVAALAGMPRHQHAYTNADALAIASRQRALNHSPGRHFSYTNTGYILLAEIVERASGSSLQEFTRERIFARLGMTSTGWRDDFRKTVPGRATAYARSSAGFVQAMPFESTVGYAGLLTTVGDLLKWNEALATAALGSFVTEALQRKVVLTTGRPVRYGRGLWVDTYAGHDEISHGGTTAGYNAWVGRYTAARLSIAMLCNAPVNDVQLAHKVADRLLPPATRTAAAKDPPEKPIRTVRLSPAHLARRAGVFISDVTGLPEIFTASDSALINGGEAGRSISADRFRFGWGDVIFDSPDRITTIETNGERRTYWRADGSKPSAEQMAALAGRYYSPGAAAMYVVGVEQGALTMRAEGRPGFVLRAAPVGPDVYRTATTLIRVHRAPNGDIERLSISASRVRELELDPVPRAGPPGAR